jgi:addiction module HigA family antidote
MGLEPIHPGEILADELEELHMTGADLAAAIHVPKNRIYQILAGKRAITADTALRLGRWFGTGEEIWISLQKEYELRLARQTIGEEIINTITPRSNFASAA